MGLIFINSLHGYPTGIYIKHCFKARQIESLCKTNPHLYPRGTSILIETNVETRSPQANRLTILTEIIGKRKISIAEKYVNIWRIMKL